MRLLGRGRRGQSGVADAGRSALESDSVLVRPGDKEAGMFGDKGQVDDGGQANTYMGKGSQIAGKLSFDGAVRIEGQVDGEITAQESIVIGEAAVVKAQMTADCIVITGKVTGDITARRRVEIRAPGKLYGNITTPSLVIHDGVVFEGHCSMGGAGSREVVEKSHVLPAGEREPGALNLESQSEAKW